MTKELTTLYFKGINKSKLGAILTENPCTAEEVQAAKDAFNGKSNGPTSALNFGDTTVKVYKALPNFGKQYMLAGDFTKVKKPVPVGTPVQVVASDTPVLTREGKVVKNLFWAHGA